MSHTIFPMAAPLIALNDGSTQFVTKSSGLGDVKLSSLINLHKGESDRALMALGVNLPTGSISKKDNIPGPGGRLKRQLPAPMQLGSGSYDLFGSFTYNNQRETGSYGFQGSTVIRLEDNSHDYRLGNRLEYGWASISWEQAPAPKDIVLQPNLIYRSSGT